MSRVANLTRFMLDLFRGQKKVMRYELMLPHQLREAIDKNWPVILPLGVLEYHANIWVWVWIRSPLFVFLIALRKKNPW